jgi:arylsulfatase A-like enzyme
MIAHTPSRKAFGYLAWSMVLTMLLGTVLPVRRAERPASRPNVVILLIDDLGYADLGCYGSKAIPTPNIDALAKGGVRCTQGYVTAGTCSPSRAGLLTGRYQQRFGFEFNCNVQTARRMPHAVGLDPTALTLADVLKAGGYATGVFGKWHLGFDASHHPQERGFDEFLGFLPGAHVYLPSNAPGIRVKDNEPGAVNQILRGKASVSEEQYLTEAFAREACAFIGRNKAKPFLLYLPFNAVHTPFQTTAEYLKRFPGVEDERRRVYYAMVSAVDEAVGRVLGALKEHGLEENTLVLLLSDNGGPTYTGVQSNGALRLGKLFLFEGGVRVPFVVRWPGVLEAGTVYDQAVSSLDVFPTVAAAAGLSLPAGLHFDGLDIVPFLKAEKKAAPHEFLYWRNGPNRAVRKGDWKLVQAGKNVWLFDLARDTGETRNLADERPRVVEELQRALDRWEAELKPPAWPSRPGEELKVDGKPYEIHI